MPASAGAWRAFNEPLLVWRLHPTLRVPGTFIQPRGDREDLRDWGRLSSSLPSFLPHPVRVVCFFMKGFHSVSVYKAGNKEQEPTGKKVGNHKAKLSAGANWPRLSNFQAKSSLTETSVLSDSAHLGHPALPWQKYGSNYVEIPNLALILASG